MDELECQHDAMQRLQNWLNVMEGRVCALLSNNDPGSMKAHEREMAASRHLVLMLRLLQLRQQYAEAKPSAGEQALLDALLHGLEEG
jgi:hypothetical protein